MKALVVLSGGMDSTVALYHTLKDSRFKEVAAVSFDYKSKHNDEEFKRAQATTKSLSVPLVRIPLYFINDFFKSDLLQSGGEIPKGHYAEENMKKTVVPFRNGIMLSIAAGYAESIEANHLVLGNHKGDHFIYNDCRKDFSMFMGEAIFRGTSTGVGLQTPFVDMTKTEICSLGNELGVNYLNTYSCYRGGPIHCGVCGTCGERRIAFHEAGVMDLTEYEDKTPIDEFYARMKEIEKSL